MYLLLPVLFLAVSVGVQGQSRGDLRLVSASGSTGGSSGRLEVYYNGHWGTVSLCGKSFNYTEAVVACKQLHYDTANSYGTANALGFSQGSSNPWQPIWLSGLNCTGTEKRLDSCPHDEIGGSLCDHSGDVGLVCEDHNTRGTTVTGTLFYSLTLALLFVITLLLACILSCNKIDRCYTRRARLRVTDSRHTDNESQTPQTLHSSVRADPLSSSVPPPSYYSTDLPKYQDLSLPENPQVNSNITGHPDESYTGPPDSNSDSEPPPPYPH